MKRAFYIGRFQPYHNGHHAVLSEIAKSTDEIVPIAHGRALAALHPRATLVELDGSHNSGHSRKSEYWRAFDAHLAAERP